MIDNKTPHLELPLPDLGNQQDEDVPRIAGALALLDAHAAQSDARMQETTEDLGGKMGGLLERLSVVEAKSPDLAKREKAGIVKIGEGISVANDGTISVNPVDIASSEKAGTVKPGMGMAVAADGALNISYWDAFPPFVPVPVWGVTFGGSDGRRAIMPGETSAREDWIRCDGGSDGKNGAVPNMKGRVLLGADTSQLPGSMGGNNSHSHTVTANTAATTLSQAQMPSHNHGFTAYVNTGYWDFAGGQDRQIQNAGSATSYSGSNASHSHSVTAATNTGLNMMPFFAMDFVIKII